MPNTNDRVARRITSFPGEIGTVYYLVAYDPNDEENWEVVESWLSGRGKCEDPPEWVGAYLKEQGEKCQA
jgi:hypothetical protein